MVSLFHLQSTLEDALSYHSAVIGLELIQMQVQLQQQSQVNHNHSHLADFRHCQPWFTVALK